MSKATRNPRVSVLRWALVKPDWKFANGPSGDCLLWRRRDSARGLKRTGERVVRVRVTVEVVE